MANIITSADFTEWVDVSVNLAQKYTSRYIELAQKRFLRPLLGSELYDDLETEIVSGTPSVDASALLEAVKPYLVFRAYELYLPNSRTFFTSMGPRELEEDNSRTISDSQIQALVDLARQNAIFFEAELLQFLDVNKDTYPLFESSEDKLEMDHPSSRLPGISASRVVKKRRFYDRED